MHAPSQPAEPAGADLYDRLAAAARRLVAPAAALARRVPTPSPRWFLPLLVACNWIGMIEAGRIATHRGWLYYDGGDGTWYYTSAWVLGHGHIPESTIGYGYSLLIAPLAAIAGSNILAGLPLIVFFNAIVLAPIALLCVYGLAKLIGGLRFAYATAIVWIVLPFAAIRYFLPDYHDRYVDITLPSALGLTALGDYPSMVCMLVSAYFAYRALSSHDRYDALAAGLAAGIAIGVKPANALFLPAALVALALTRRPRQLGLFVAGIAPSVVALALWKYRGLGDLPLFSHQDAVDAAGAHLVAPLASAPIHLGRYLHFDYTSFKHTMDGFREWGWSKRLIEWVIVAGLIGLARRSLTGVLLIGGWFLTYLLVKGGDPIITMEAGNFLTHMIPAIPAFVLVGMSAVFCLPIYGRRRLAPAATASFPRSPRARRRVAALLAFLAVVPIGVFVILRPLQGAGTADLGIYDVLIPNNSFSVSSTQSGGVVSLRWPDQPTDGTRANYIIFRASSFDRTAALTCSGEPHAAEFCAFQARVRAIVSDSRSTFEDRPGPGIWNYTVALAASASGPPSGNQPIMLSSSTSVTVPVSYGTRRAGP